MFFFPAFSKRLASMADDRPYSSRTSSPSTLRHEVVADRKAIPKDAISLDPLNHQHEGVDCDIVRRNRAKIQSIEREVVSRRNEHEMKLDSAAKPLRLAQDQHRALTHELHSIHAYEPQRTEQYINPIEQQFNYDIQLLQNKESQLRNNLNDLRNAIPQSLAATVVTKNTQYGPHCDYSTSKSQYTKSHQQQLLDVDKQISHLSTTYNSSTKDGPTRINQLRSSYENDLSTLTKQKDRDVEALQRVYQAKRSSLLPNQRVGRDYDAKCASMEQQLMNKKTALNNTVNEIAKSSKLSHTEWDGRLNDAEAEVKNMRTKIGLYKEAMNKELNALSAVNKQRLSNYRSQLDAERANTRLVNKHERDQLNHLHDNTSIELSWGTTPILLPVASETIIQQPVIKPVLVQSVEAVAVPVVTHIPVTDDFYLRDGENTGKRFDKQLKLGPVPSLDNAIVHSTTVPRINAVAEEVVEIKKITVPQQKIETVFETVQAVTNSPKTVLHTTETHVIPVLDLINTTTTISTEQTPSRSSTNATTTTRSSRK
jgi:hypothetical protein